jgi:hypothetical protein
MIRSRHEREKISFTRAKWPSIIAEETEAVFGGDFLAHLVVR